jgi:hypothetical protein
VDVIEISCFFRTYTSGFATVACVLLPLVVPYKVAELWCWKFKWLALGDEDADVRKWGFLVVASGQ